MIIGLDLEQYFPIGSQLPPMEKAELVKFLKTNIDVFACHRLNVNPEVVPRKQPPWRLSKDHIEAVRTEVNKLKQAGAIKEIFYPEWLVNTVVVKKKNGKWRVCMDFRDLNKVCPRDPLPILRIDQLMDATVGHLRISFLDAF